MKNHITFRINTFANNKLVSLSETDLSTSNVEFDTMNGIDGEVIIADSSNEIHIVDELWYLAINACFNTSTPSNNAVAINRLA